jgi:hypothetical protein
MRVDSQIAEHKRYDDGRCVMHASFGKLILSQERAPLVIIAEHRLFVAVAVVAAHLSPPTLRAHSGVADGAAIPASRRPVCVSRLDLAETEIGLG